MTSSVRTKALSGAEAARQFRRNPENNRLYLEAEVRQSLAEHMVSLRLAAGLTQKALADRVGRKQSFVARLETGAYDRCGLSTLRTFVRAMGHDIDMQAMFTAIGEAEYSGASSCGDLEETIVELAGDSQISHISLANWERTDFRSSMTPVNGTLIEVMNAAA